MSTTKKPAKGAAPKTPEKFTTNLLLRVSPDLIKRIDERVAQMQDERPGMSRSDFVREAVLRALRE